MTDQPPNIIGPIAGLAAIGVMAYGAKTIIDVMKEKAQEEKGKKRATQFREKYEYTPKANSSPIDRGLDKMLRR